MLTENNTRLSHTSLKVFRLCVLQAASLKLCGCRFHVDLTLLLSSACSFYSRHSELPSKKYVLFATLKYD